MKVSFERKALVSALTLLGSNIASRSNIPILKTILFETSADAATLTATDTDANLVVSVPCEVTEGGSACIFWKELHAFAKSGKGDFVTIETTEIEKRLTFKIGCEEHFLTTYQTSISCGAVNGTVLALSVEDFPRDLIQARAEKPFTFSLDAAALQRILTKTNFAVSTEETRYSLNGTYLHAVTDCGKPFLRAVATDGHRLACIDSRIDSLPENMPGIIVPRHTLGLLGKILNKKSPAVDIALSSKAISFQCGNVSLLSRTIDGTFPDYTRVIPSKNDKTLSAPKVETAALVKQLSAMSSTKSKAVKLTMGTDSLVASMSDPESGTSQGSLAASWSEATPFEISFNGRLLQDIFDAMDGNEFVAAFADRRSPALFTDPADSRAKFVLMPMRV